MREDIASTPERDTMQASLQTSSDMEKAKEPRPSILQEFLTEFPVVWRAIPHKGLFTFLFVIWTLLFEFWGTGVFGHYNSLYFFMCGGYRNPDDSHGYLIPVVILALFWWKRKDLAEFSTRLWSWGLAILAIAIFWHFVGYAVQQSRLSMLALFLGWYALIGIVWGPAVMKASFFPMCLLVFAIPLGTIADIITVPLRILATTITTFLAADVLGMNIVQRGTQIIDLNGNFQFEVAAACSGLRSLTAVLALCTIYGFMNFRSTSRRAIMVLSAFPLAIVGNVIRLLTLIMVSEAFGRHRGEAFHDSTFFSLLPYVPAILGILALGHFLRERPGGEEAKLLPAQQIA